MNKKFKSKTDITQFKDLPDSEIDYSDNPKTDETFWRDAKVIMPPKKVHISVRLDEEVVDYFKQDGKGYQSRINAVLRSYVNAHK